MVPTCYFVALCLACTLSHGFADKVKIYDAILAIAEFLKWHQKSVLEVWDLYYVRPETDSVRFLIEADKTGRPEITMSHPGTIAKSMKELWPRYAPTKLELLKDIPPLSKMEKLVSGAEKKRQAAVEKRAADRKAVDDEIRAEVDKLIGPTVFTMEDMKNWLHAAKLTKIPADKEDDYIRCMEAVLKNRLTKEAMDAEKFAKRLCAGFKGIDECD